MKTKIRHYGCVEGSRVWDGIYVSLEGNSVPVDEIKNYGLHASHLCAGPFASQELADRYVDRLETKIAAPKEVKKAGRPRKSVK